MAEKPTYEELEQRVKKLEKEVVEKGRLKEQLHLMSLAILQSSEGIAVVGLNGELKYLNDAFSLMHGYSPEELIGKNLSIFHSREQLPSVDAANRQLKETGDFKGEVWHMRRDGTEFPTMMHNWLIKDDEGKPLGMVGTLRDISDIKQAAEVLRESEEKFRLISEQSLMAIVILQDNGIKYANQAYAAMTGHSLKEIMNWTIADTAKLIHADDRDFVMEQGQKKTEGIKEGTVTRYSYRGVAKTGEVRWIDQYSKTITYEGKPADLITMIDIHEQKVAQESLRESEERYRTILESIEEAYFEVDIVGNFTFFNPIFTTYNS